MPRRCPCEVVGRVTARHVAPPAAEARLQHERQLRRRRRRAVCDQPRARVRHAGTPEDARGEQLVVRGHECRRRIQNLDTARGEALEVGLPLLHPVERLADVEPPQRDVPRLEEAESVARR